MGKRRKTFRKDKGGPLVSSPVKIYYAAPSKGSYSAYLKTPHWKKMRLEALKRWEGMCENCGKQPATEVHHKTYVRLGRELMSDLMPVCRPCHESEHKKQFFPRRSGPNRNLFYPGLT